MCMHLLFLFCRQSLQHQWTQHRTRRPELRRNRGQLPPQHVVAPCMSMSKCVCVCMSLCSFLCPDSCSFYLWPQIMILLCNQQSFICTHIDFCHPRCYQHHSRSCARLVRAIKLVYGETVDSLREDSASSGHIGGRAKKSKEVGF